MFLLFISMLENPLISFIVFLAVVFLYLHLTAQWKRGEDLEIYEMDYQTNAQLQEVCSVRQPVLFEMTPRPEIYSRIHVDAMSKYDTFDIHIKDTLDYLQPETVDYVSLPFHSGIRLMETDTGARYITETNHEFLDETGIDHLLKEMDQFLKPSYCMYSKYDLMMGSNTASTPLRYHTAASQFITPTSGKIRVKMTPWKSRRFLHPIKDYETYEFRSPINCWSPGPEYTKEMEKLKFLDFEVNEGYVLYIPPYWWCSIQYTSASTVASFTYDTVIGALAHSYDWCLYFAQQGNITTKVDKVIEVDEIQRENDTKGLPHPSMAKPEDMAVREEPPKLPKEKREIITNAGVYQVA